MIVLVGAATDARQAHQICLGAPDVEEEEATYRAAM